MFGNNRDSDIPTHAVVIYHDHCADGFGAAWAFKTVVEIGCQDYSDGVKYIPCRYGEVPSFSKEDTNADLYILDFSFPRANLLTLAGLFASVTVLDHHKTAAEDLQDWDHGMSNLEIVFDMKRSGAGIAWDYFATYSQQRPTLIDYIEDRDIWAWQLPGSHEINSLIGFTKREFAAYDRLSELLESKFDAAIGMGNLLLEQQQRHVTSIIAATKRPIEINGRHGLVCNCTGQFASDVGNELAKESGTFGATYFQDSQDAMCVSLRSEGDYDVSEIAKQFGGGGHKNAAGFKFSAPIPNAAGSGVTLWNIPDGNT